MDVAAVRQLASQMQHAGQQVKQITTQLTAELQGAAWVGDDQKAFESDWNGNHVRQLNQVAEALTDAARIANQNASQQEAASRG